MDLISINDIEVRETGEKSDARSSPPYRPAEEMTFATTSDSSAAMQLTDTQRLHFSGEGRTAETKGVGNDGNGAERHGGAGNHGTQQHSEEGIEHTRCNGNSQ